jgi:hypothetical protein
MMGVVFNAKRTQVTLELRKPQLEIFNDPHRFKTVVAGRRFGKTFLAKGIIVDKATNKARQEVGYIAPTYRQAKNLMWRPLKEMLPRSYVHDKNETGLTLTLRNKSVISLYGSDNPDSLRGIGLDLAIIDEAAFQDPYVWKVVRPALADRGGEAVFITTPKGYNHFYDLVMKSLDKPNWKHWHFTTLEGGNVPAEEIEEARSILDPRMFRQEFEASFENLAGRVYYAFDRILNVDDTIQDNLALPLKVGIDFNIDPMSACMGTRENRRLRCFDEIEIMNGNTMLLAQELRRRYPNRPIVAYPDPTGQHGSTNANAGQTDFAILRSYGIQVIAPNGPYAMADKINMTNAALCNANNERRASFHPRCKKTIKALDGQVYIDGTKIPDKKTGLDHMSDAFAYMACYEYPLVQFIRRIETVGT